MSSRTELTWHIGIKWAFSNKYIKCKYFKSDWIKCKFKEMQHSTTRNSYNWVYYYSNVSMHFRIIFWKFKIIIYKIRTYLLYIHLVQKLVFNPKYIVKAVQDDISWKTIWLWLHDAHKCHILCRRISVESVPIWLHRTVRLLWKEFDYPKKKKSFHTLPPWPC